MEAIGKPNSSAVRLLCACSTVMEKRETEIERERESGGEAAIM